MKRDVEMKIKWKQEIEEIQRNYKIYSRIAAAIIYFFSIVFIIYLSKQLIEYPLALAYKYHIQFSDEQYVNLYGSYSWVFIAILIIAIFAIPIMKLTHKLKKASKDGAEFYKTDDMEQNTILTTPKMVDQSVIRDIISSDDSKECDEKVEEELYDNILENREKQLEYFKCKDIKSQMKPLTMMVTRELYCNNIDNINFDIILDYVKNISGHKRTKEEEKSKKVTQSIITFLKNNDIIESDDMETDKYYFTHTGKIFMNYFSSGII